jgi:hypothetical protein
MARYAGLFLLRAIMQRSTAYLTSLLSQGMPYRLAIVVTASTFGIPEHIVERAFWRT